MACSSLGHSNRRPVVQWMTSACPDAEQADPCDIAQGQAVDYATEARREYPWALTEGVDLAVEAHYAGKVNSG